MLEILQEDKLHCSVNYDYSKVRLFLLEESDLGLGVGKQHKLIKATSNGNKRSTFFEMRLDPGTYKILVDIENKGELFERKYDMIIHSSNDWFKQTPLPLALTKNLIMETFSNLAVQRGKVELLNKERSLRRYSFKSEKIGIYVITYANRSSNCYSILDKIDIKGSEFKLSKPIEHGKFRVTVASNVKKFIVIRFSGKDFEVKILDCSVRVRE